MAMTFLTMEETMAPCWMNWSEATSQWAFLVVCNHCSDSMSNTDTCNPFYYLYLNNRQREQPHSVSDTTSHTPAAAVVVRFRFTFRISYAQPVDTQERKWRIQITLSKPSDALPLEPDVCVTWSTWHVNSRTDSERVELQRSKSSRVKEIIITKTT